MTVSKGSGIVRLASFKRIRFSLSCLNVEYLANESCHFTCVVNTWTISMSPVWWSHWPLWSCWCRSQQAGADRRQSNHRLNQLQIWTWMKYTMEGGITQLIQSKLGCRHNFPLRKVKVKSTSKLKWTKIKISTHCVGSAIPVVTLFQTVPEGCECVDLESQCCC